MTYDEIVQAALSYADRVDTETMSQMDIFLRVVEARINRKIKTQEMSVRSQLTLIEGQEYYALPNDYGGMRDIEIRPTNSSSKRIPSSYLNPEQFDNAVTNNLNENYYTIVAGQIQIYPTQPTGYILEIIYYRKLIPLNSTNTENWLSINNPDAYIFGLMTEIKSFVQDKEGAVLWDSRFKESIDDIDLNDSKTRWAGNSLQVRVT